MSYFFFFVVLFSWLAFFISNIFLLKKQNEKCKQLPSCDYFFLLVAFLTVGCVGSTKTFFLAQVGIWYQYYTYRPLQLPLRTSYVRICIPQNSRRLVQYKMKDAK